MILAALGRIEAQLPANNRTAAEESPAPLEQIRSLLMCHLRVIGEGLAVPRITFSYGHRSSTPTSTGFRNSCVRGNRSAKSGPT
jgi:hypothetical protein